MASPCVIQIGFNVNDSLASVRALIRDLDPLLACEECSTSWHVDLSTCRYIGPDGAAVLLAAVLNARNFGLAVRVTLPDEPPQLDGFCAFSGLKHHLLGEPMPDASVPENETVPLRIFQRANFGDPEPLIALIRRHIPISRDSEDYLSLSIREVTQNVEDHAQSRIGGVLCARYLSGQQHVRVAIVDFGAGIALTLAQRHPEIKTSAMALRRVTAGETSAGSRPHNRGLGISWLWSIVGTLSGRIFIVSCNGAAQKSEDGRSTISVFDPPFPGTGVFFTLPVEAGLERDD